MLSIQEIRSSTEKELQLELELARREFFRSGIGTKTKHIKNTRLVGNQKRYIAQLLTVLNEIRHGKVVPVKADVSATPVRKSAPRTSSRKSTSSKTRRSSTKKAA